MMFKIGSYGTALVAFVLTVPAMQGCSGVAGESEFGSETSAESAPENGICCSRTTAVDESGSNGHRRGGVPSRPIVADPEHDEFAHVNFADPTGNGGARRNDLNPGFNGGAHHSDAPVHGTVASTQPLGAPGADRHTGPTHRAGHMPRNFTPVTPVPRPAHLAPIAPTRPVAPAVSTPSALPPPVVFNTPSAPPPVVATAPTAPTPPVVAPVVPEHVRPVVPATMPLRPTDAHGVIGSTGGGHVTSENGEVVFRADPLTVAHGDGTVTTDHGNGERTTDHRNGERSTAHADGTTTTEHADGSRTTHHPATETAGESTTHNPAGDHMPSSDV